MVSAEQALELLKEGNRRFVSNIYSPDAITNGGRSPELVHEQKPFAIVLACSDSRVPVELVFGQGFGALFVIRVAGNVVTPSQIGSIEFAAQHFGTRLVVVLGHTNCGAIKATLEHLECSQESLSPNILAIIEQIKPSLENLVDKGLAQDPEALLKAATRAHICHSTNLLVENSTIIQDLIESRSLSVVGAEYSLESGVVEFFDEALSQYKEILTQERLHGFGSS